MSPDIARIKWINNTITKNHRDKVTVVFMIHTYETF